MSGQIVDATIVAAPTQRNTSAEKKAGDYENDLVSGRRILRTWMMPVITRRSADALPGSAYLDRVRRLAYHLAGPHALVGRNC
jgi:hypothetical protein